MLRATPASDCERIDVVGVAQAVNTATSLAYLVAGIVVMTVGRRRPVAVLLGVLLLGEAAGSALYHGDPGTVAQWLHDVAFLGILGLLAGWHVGRLFGREDAGAWVGALGITTVAGLAHPTLTGAVTAVAVVLVVVVVVAEAVAQRRTPRLSPVFDGRLVAIVVVAGVAYGFGRSGSPLCDPDSVVQLHGAWHVLSALAVGDVGRSCAPSRPLKASWLDSGPDVSARQQRSGGGGLEQSVDERTSNAGPHRFTGGTMGGRRRTGRVRRRPWSAHSALGRAGWLGRRPVRRAPVGSGSASGRCRTGALR